MYLIQHKKKQVGFSLIELMIAIALGMIIITGVVYVASSGMRTNTETLRTTRLEQELRGVLLMLNRDLKRAGYYANAGNVLLCSANSNYTLSATSGTAITATLTAGNGACSEMGVQTGDRLMNITGIGSGTIVTSCATVSAVSGTPATTLTLASATCPGAASSVAFPSTTLDPGAWTIIKNGATILVTNAPGDADAASDCVTYGYDLDSNGQIDADEVFGFRYNSTTESIETLNDSGSLTDCSAGNWVNQTDESSIRITNLDIAETDTTNTAANVNVTMRELQFTITGTLESVAGSIPINRSYTETVKVRNDLLN
jgi:type II secretory pathway component PulJ